MDYILTHHAKKRLLERSIPEKLIKDALRNPTKISYDNKGMIMNKKNIKILYDKESKVFSVEMKRVKSADSDIYDNVIIDYDKNGKIVRVNFYDFSFNAFRENLKELKNFTRKFNVPLLIR